MGIGPSFNLRFFGGPGVMFFAQTCGPHALLRRVPFCCERRKIRALPRHACQNYQRVYIRSTGLKPFLPFYSRFSAPTKRRIFYTFKSLRASSVLYDKLFTIARCACLEKPLKLPACRASARALPNALRELAVEKQSRCTEKRSLFTCTRRWLRLSGGESRSLSRC